MLHYPHWLGVKWKLKLKVQDNWEQQIHKSVFISSPSWEICKSQHAFTLQEVNLLKSLESFGVGGEGTLEDLLWFCCSISIVYAGVVIWGRSIKTMERKRLDNLFKKASSVLGCPLDSVQLVGEKRVMAKLLSLMQNRSQPMQDTLRALESCFSECVKKRYQRSFLPAAVRLYYQYCSQ